jgi:hypothetical protein
MPKEMKRILDRAASTERRTHDYKNQTGYLEASTFAGDIEHNGDDYTVDFGARAPYAEYVNNRGLMHIDELGQEAETMIDYFIDAEAEKLCGM